MTEVTIDGDLSTNTPRPGSFRELLTPRKRATFPEEVCHRAFTSSKPQTN
jgi:hypothetical protein